jgi:DivIVA domain-containing protein
VDDLFDLLLAGAAVASDVESADFTMRRFGRAYDKAAVDAALSAELDRLHALADAGLGADAPAASPPGDQSAVAAPPAPDPVPSPGGRRFRVTRMGPGYVIEDVDAFMARVDAGLVTAGEVDHVEFRSTRMASGYREQDVDEALDRVVADLRSRGR